MSKLTLFLPAHSAGVFTAMAIYQVVQCLLINPAEHLPFLIIDVSLAVWMMVVFNRQWERNGKGQ